MSTVFPRFQAGGITKSAPAGKYREGGEGVAPVFSVSTKFHPVFLLETRQFIEFVKTLGKGEGVCYNIGKCRVTRLQRQHHLPEATHHKRADAARKGWIVSMGIADVISLLGGLAFFLFGMSLLGDGLKKVAGSRLETILGRLTSNPVKGVLLGEIGRAHV